MTAYYKGEVLILRFWENIYLTERKDGLYCLHFPMVQRTEYCTDKDAAITWFFEEVALRLDCSVNDAKMLYEEV